jgi:hypothetical protein
MASTLAWRDAVVNGLVGDVPYSYRMTTFFVPDGEGNPVQDEALYAEMARIGRRAPEPPDRRIRSISWTSRGEEWTATVGQTLQGVKVTHRPPSRGGTKTEQLRDSARVLAIFSGDPYMVVTDVGLGARSSAWVNPIMTSPRPSAVEYFDPLETQADPS